MLIVISGINIFQITQCIGLYSNNLSYWLVIIWLRSTKRQRVKPKMMLTYRQGGASRESSVTFRPRNKLRREDNAYENSGHLMKTSGFAMPLKLLYFIEVELQ